MAVVSEGDTLDALAAAADATPTVQTVSDLAVGLFKAAAYEDGMRTFQDAIDLLTSTDAEAHLHLAECLATTHLHGEALEMFVRHLALRDGFPLGNERAIDVVLDRKSVNDPGLASLPALTYTVRYLVAFELEMRKQQSLRLPPR